MQLTLWTYEGPTHVGAMRIATAMKGVHYVLHAPQGDTYADLLFTMIERRDRRPPVTYTTFQARDLGGDTAELFKTAAREAYERFQPQAMLVGASCTAELIQDDPAGLALALNLPVPVIPLELPSYQRKENWGASETFYRLVRALCPATPAAARSDKAGGPRCNILGPTALGFRHRDDLREIRSLIEQLGVTVNVVAPLDASPADITRLGDADFNVVLYPEIANTAAQWLTRTFKQPATKTIPIGVTATREFIAEVCALAGIELPAEEASRATWYSRSVDSTYLTGKRVFVFGDATHAVAAARVASEELGFTVVGLGTYSREFAREIREAAAKYGIEPLISDDYIDIEAKVAELQPELVLGTQMERHIAKRLGIPCAVISAPVHVQDFPARYSPQMGFEGANVLFDTWVQPLMMGLEEHLLHMFRDDFEFHPEAAASHLGGLRQAQGEPDESVRAESNTVRAEPHTVRAEVSKPSEQLSPSITLRANGSRVTSQQKTSSPPGPPKPSASFTRFPSLYAARRGATPSALRANVGCTPSPLRRSTMQKRTSAADASAATPMRVVLVTLDSHVAGAAARAEKLLRRELPGLVFSVHAASEWGEDGAALQRCIDDIARGDIVIATMLFMEEHFLPVLPALKARRDACDAMICAMSAGEVMKLTRMGKFAMDAKASGPMALLKRLRGKPKAEGENAAPASGAAQMKMLRRLPQILRFVPGTAQDVRAYFLTLQYWLAGSDDNIANLLRLLVERYAEGPRKALRGMVKAQSPVHYPEVGVYHPGSHARSGERMSEDARSLPAAGKNGSVGLLLMRSYLLAGNSGHYDGVIAALEARGLNVIPAFASGLDSRPAIERFFLNAQGRPVVDAVISLTGFSLVGGPAYNDAKAAEEILAKLDVPYIAAMPVEFQSLGQWQDSARGLLPVEATMMVAIPELDGATGSMVFGGRADGAAQGAAHDMVVATERAAMLASRVAKWVALRRRTHAERKVGVVLFNFPPNAGAAGTAAFLSVFESLFNLLTAMKRDGYTVDVPADVDALRAQLLEGNAARYGAGANVHARIATDAHVRAEPHLAQIEAQWGPAPGRQQADGASIHVLGASFGNVFVGLQPAFGYEGDPMRLLFESGFAPTHAFSAFYRWLREDFKADALLHFGTHGALEFMPGKQAGLSGECWPDRLVADVPNLYLYASNNPSEGTIAKRRAAATLVSYLTPPVTQAGLYCSLADLKASIERWRGMPPADPLNRREREELSVLIQTQAAAVELAPATPAWNAQSHDAVHALSLRVSEVEHALIPHGLHVVGKAPTEVERIDMLMAMGESMHGTAPERAAVQAIVRGDALDAVKTSGAAIAGRHRPPTLSRTTKRWRCCTHSTAALCAPHPVVICCARPACCLPAATCTALIPSACRALSRCATVPSRQNVCLPVINLTATAFQNPSPWCSGAPTT